MSALDWRPTEVIVPIRSGLNRVTVLASDHRNSTGRGLIIPLRSVEEVLVIVGPGFEIVINTREIGVIKDVRESPPLALKAKAALPRARVTLPPTTILLLVLLKGPVADTGLCLNVIPEDVLGALTICPDVLAGDRAGVATDALVKVEDHRKLGTDVHCIPPLRHSR